MQPKVNFYAEYSWLEFRLFLLLDWLPLKSPVYFGVVVYVRMSFSVLVSLFTGISIFIGYLMPEPSLYKNGCGIIQLIAGLIRGFTPFPRVLVQN